MSIVLEKGFQSIDFYRNGKVAGVERLELRTIIASECHVVCNSTTVSLHDNDPTRGHTELN